jgi:hypothetical protein
MRWLNIASALVFYVFVLFVMVTLPTLVSVASSLAFPSVRAADAHRTARVLPFRTFAKGLTSAWAGPAWVYVLTNRREALRALVLGGSDDLRLTRYRFRSRIILAVLDAQQPNAGRQFRVRRISLLRSRQFCITVAVGRIGDLTEPKAAYHYVMIRRSQLPPRMPRAWQLIDGQGNVLGASRRAARCTLHA